MELKVQCKFCGEPQMVDLEKIKAPPHETSCGKCGNTYPVDQEKIDEALAPPPPPVSDLVQSFNVLKEDGTSLGPLKLEELKAAVREGKVGRKAQIYTPKGEWVPALRMAEIRTLFPPEAPKPAPPPGAGEKAAVLAGRLGGSAASAAGNALRGLGRAWAGLDARVRAGILAGAGGLALGGALGAFLAHPAPPPPPRTPTVEEIFQRGKAAYDRKATLEAMLDFQRVLYARPQDARAHGYMGLSLFALGRCDEAVPYLETGLADPGMAKAGSWSLAMCLVRQQAWTRARDAFLKFTALDPSNYDAQAQLGYASFRAADWKTAETAFQNAYRLAKDDPRRNNGAWALDYMKRVEEEIKKAEAPPPPPPKAKKGKKKPTQGPPGKKRRH